MAIPLAFVSLASVRDVYLGGLFQRWSPLHVAIVAFTLCSAVFLPIARARDAEGLRTLLRRRGDLFWVNVTSAIAWISLLPGAASDRGVVPADSRSLASRDGRCAGGDAGHQPAPPQNVARRWPSRGKSRGPS